MELYELIIDENNDSGVNYIALVDSPAIESNWQAFSKQKKKPLKFKIENEEKRIISGYLMKADLPIYRIDEHGEYYVVFKKNTIIEIVKKFMRNGFTRNTNLDHSPHQLADNVWLIESIIIDKDRGTQAPKGFEDAPDGSWFGSMYVGNNAIWEEIKAGTFKGFSVEGMFLQRPIADLDTLKIEQIKEIIKEYETKNGQL